MIDVSMDDRKSLKQEAGRAEQPVCLSLIDRVCQESEDQVWNPVKPTIKKISIQSLTPKAKSEQKLEEHRE